MQILVSDTSVIIDLDRASLLEAVFKNQTNLIMPDLLFLREFGSAGDRLLKFGLTVASLNPIELETAQGLHLTEKALSLPDCFALVLSLREHHVLLTGDKALRQIAESKQVECHGVLWLFDELLRTKAVSQKKLFRALMVLSSHPRCRLPNGEIKRRLKQWQNF